jgi:hypothetical protein
MRSNKIDISQLCGNEFLKHLKHQRVPVSALAYKANVNVNDIQSIANTPSVPEKLIKAYQNHFLEQE